MHVVHLEVLSKHGCCAHLSKHKCYTYIQFLKKCIFIVSKHKCHV